MIGAVGVDDPQVRQALVGHDVGEAAHVDHLLAVGRDLRIGGGLEVEDVHRLERFGGGRRGDGRDGERETDEGSSDHWIASSRFSSGAIGGSPFSGRSR